MVSKCLRHHAQVACLLDGAGSWAVAWFIGGSFVVVLSTTMRSATDGGLT